MCIGIYIVIFSIKGVNLYKYDIFFSEVCNCKVIYGVIIILFCVKESSIELIIIEYQFGRMFG